jgi:hypothetical protein
MKDGLEAGRPRGGAPKRQGAKVPGSDKRQGAKTARVQYHLGENVVERLGVHCSLVHRSCSAVVEEILLSWLQRFGRGKELWGPDAGPGVVSDEVDRAGAA